MSEPWTRRSAKKVIKELFTRTHEYSEVAEMYETVIKNAKRDGVRTVEKHLDKLYGRIINSEDRGKLQKFQGNISVPIRYDILLHDEHDYELSFSTMMHELAHLYCGHWDGSERSWWPNRTRLGIRPQEIEAECVAHLVCRHLGIDNYSREYLSGYVKDKRNLPAEDSLDCILRAANLIEEMCKGPMEPREPANWLNVDVILLDGMITFLIPEHGSNVESGQMEYTRKSLKMKGTIQGYWRIQAKTYPQWESIIHALDTASDNAKNKNKRINPTRDSRKNIDEVTRKYQENRRGALLNRSRMITAKDIKEFERLRSRYLSGSRLHIHTMIQGTWPGLIAWRERQPANKQLRLVKRRAPSIVMEWQQDDNNMLYKIVKNKMEAKKFLDDLKKAGWELYGYTSRVQDVWETLERIEEDK